MCQVHLLSSTKEFFLVLLADQYKKLLIEFHSNVGYYFPIGSHWWPENVFQIVVMFLSLNITHFEEERISNYKLNIYQQFPNAPCIISVGNGLFRIVHLYWASSLQTTISLGLRQP